MIGRDRWSRRPAEHPSQDPRPRFDGRATCRGAPSGHACMDRRPSLAGQAARLDWTVVFATEILEPSLARCPSKHRRASARRWKTVRPKKAYRPARRRVSVRLLTLVNLGDIVDMSRRRWRSSTIRTRPSPHEQREQRRRRAEAQGLLSHAPARRVDYGDHIEQITYLLFLKMRGVEIPTRAAGSFACGTALPLNPPGCYR
jgi:hypothetical protein